MMFALLPLALMVMPVDTPSRVDVASIVLSRRLNDFKQPNEITGYFHQHDTINAVIEINQASTHDSLVAVWVYVKDAQRIPVAAEALEKGANRKGYYLSRHDPPLPVGEYRLEAYINHRFMMAKSFMVE